MVKNLYLLRHGEAQQDFRVKDFNRPLTPNGRNHLINLGIRLKRSGFYPDTIYCSSADRTKETSEILVEQLDYMLPVQYLKEIYDASVRTLFELIAGTSDEHSTILIIGHNPGISYLYDYLTQVNHSGLSPGEMVRVSFDIQAWGEISKGSGVKSKIFSEET